MSQWLHISAHPLPSAGRRKASHPSKPCRTTSAPLDAPTLQLDRRLRRSHTMAVLQSIRPAPLCQQTSLSLIPATLRELRSATDLALRARPRPSHRKVYGRPGGARAPPVAHADEIKDADQGLLLDAPISPSGLFGPVVKGFAEHFTEAQKASQVMRHFLPSAPAQQLLRVTQDLRRLSSREACTCHFCPSACQDSADARAFTLSQTPPLSEAPGPPDPR